MKEIVDKKFKKIIKDLEYLALSVNILRTEINCLSKDKDVGTDDADNELDNISDATLSVYDTIREIIWDIERERCTSCKGSFIHPDDKNRIPEYLHKQD